MDLYLIRHAEAVPLGEAGISSDEDRPLTEKGIVQSRNLAHGLSRTGIHFDAVVSSPLDRARQTAEAMLESWPPPAPGLQICPDLAPGFKRRRLARYLEQLAKENVALVGHQPDLSFFAAWLIGSKKAQVDLAKGGVALVQTDADVRKGSGTLLWLVTPEWLAPRA